MLNAPFFAHIRDNLLGGRMPQTFVDGCNAIYEKGKHLPLRHLAYVFATAYHETAHTMMPVRETLAKSDKEAIRRLEAAWRAGKLPQVRTPYWRPDEKGRAYFGRGFVQLTHKANYARYGIENTPEKALDPEIAAHILVDGMENGRFTSKKLADFDRDDGLVEFDAVQARKIVNGTDKAREIARYYAVFVDALSTTLPVAGAAEEAIVTTGKPIVQSTTAQAATGIGALAVVGSAITEAKDALEPVTSVLPFSPAWLIAAVTIALAAYIIRERWLKSQNEGV